jgi:hypothetical protein
MKLLGVLQESRDGDYPRPHEAASPPFVGKWGVLGYYLPAGLMPSDDGKRYLEGPHDGGRGVVGGLRRHRRLPGRLVELLETSPTGRAYIQQLAGQLFEVYDRQPEVFGE